MLAIERDWRIRKLIRANLEALGLEVRDAVTEHHGLELLGERRPDLILLDLELPGADLPQLIHALHAGPDGQPVPVVVMSADPPVRQLLCTDDVAGHLQKPFAASVLLDVVGRALRLSASQGGEAMPVGGTICADGTISAAGDRG